MLPYDVVVHGMIGFACQLYNPPIYWISEMLCLEKLYAGIKSIPPFTKKSDLTTTKNCATLLAV
jgi:hypothetical protein